MMQQKLEVKNTSKTRYVQPCMHVCLLSREDIETGSGEVTWLGTWNDEFTQSRDNTFVGGVN